MKNETAKIRLTTEEKRYLMSEAKRLNTSLSSLIRNSIAINPQLLEKRQ